MYKTRSLVILLLLTGVLSSSAFFLFPAIAAEGVGSQVLLAMAIATSVTQLLSVGYFLTSLHAFKKRLRRAYYMVTAGILIYTLVVLPSVVETTGFLIGDAVRTGLSIVPYVFGPVIIFLGVRKFARLLELRSPWSSFWPVAGVSLLFAAAASFVPHAPVEVDEVTYDIILGLLIWSGGFSIAATVTAVQIRRVLGANYKDAMGWLALALAVLSFASFHEYFIKGIDWVATYAPDYYNYSLAPYMLTGILLLGAAIFFKAVSRKLNELPEDASYLDVITYVAQLVSNPKAMDVTLDKVREITATQKTSAELTPAHKTTLINVYMQLEDYLVTKEPLVKITRESLRSQLPDDFLQAVTSHSKAKPAKSTPHSPSPKTDN